MKGRGSAWTSGSSEYGKPPLRFCPLRRIEGTASPLAGKSRGPGSSQKNTGTIKRARHRTLPEWLCTYRRDSGVDQGSTVTKIEHNGQGDVQ